MGHPSELACNAERREELLAGGQWSRLCRPFAATAVASPGAVAAIGGGVSVLATSERPPTSFLDCTSRAEDWLDNLGARDGRG
jgi:hypothetical protein